MNKIIGNFRINLERNIISIYDNTTGGLLKAKHVMNLNNSEFEFNQVCERFRTRLSELKAA